MKKTKSQSGITLIALIITILVLLILAGVAIKSIQDGGILTKAQQAADKHTQAQEDELAMLDSYLSEITKVQAKVGKVEGLKVGDYIRYNGENYLVLHNSDSEGLQIVSSQLKKDLTLKGFRDVEDRFKIFKNACAEYVKSDLGAIDGRVLGTTFNEINSLVNTNTVGLKVVDGETTRLIKVYGTAEEDAGLDGNNALTVLPKIAANIGINKVWCSTVYWGTTYWAPYYVDLTADGYFDIYTMTTFASAGEANTVVATDDPQGLTAKILPIILMDARITITGGDGLTPETAYTYTFNG